jgi:hypothetical protein
MKRSNCLREINLGGCGKAPGAFPFSRLSKHNETSLWNAKLRYGTPILLLNEFSTADIAPKRIKNVDKLPQDKI